MAIGKSNTGGGFKGVLKYVLEKDGAKLIHARGVAGQDPEIIAGQFRAVADMRKIKNPVLHISFSLKPGEIATEEQLQVAADALVKSMGFDLDQTQYIVGRHNDKDHDHIHIIINRVQLNNVVVSDFQHKKRTHEATRQAEKAAGLSAFESTKDKHVQKQQLRTLIDAATKTGNYEKFKQSLAGFGIEVVENKSATTGRISGISYRTDEFHFKGSGLGRAYSLNGIQKRLDAQLQLGNINPYPTTNGHPTASQAGSGLSIGGSGTNLARNLRKGREGLGLSQGQKDRIRKESSHEL